MAGASRPPTRKSLLPPGPRKCFELALDEARTLGHNYIGTEHLLLGLIREGEEAARILEAMDPDLPEHPWLFASHLERVRWQVIHLFALSPSADML